MPIPLEQTNLLQPILRINLEYYFFKLKKSLQILNNLENSTKCVLMRFRNCYERKNKILNGGRS